LEEKLKRLAEEASLTLRGGGIVAFPTETVYALGADPGSESAVKRIFSLKGRAREKPLTLLFSDGKEVARYARNVPKSAQKLIDAFWPGPLTLVFRASSEVQEHLAGPGPSIGTRATRSATAQAIIDAFGSPVATTSANLSGEEPLRSGSEVSSQFGEKIDVVVPGFSGVSPPSAILNISRFPPTLERSGGISPLAIARVMGRRVKLGKNVFFRILIVCTGNACRSPMAEGLLKRMLPGPLKKLVIVSSAGTDPIEGRAPTPNATLAARELGADISGLVSRTISPEMIAGADLVLTMEQAHRDRVAELVPEAWEKTDLLKGYGQKGIPTYVREIRDPIGMPLDFYKAIADDIDSNLRSVVAELRRCLLH
jgi:L-threonylcarbamoyladenylate synthase